MTNAYPHPQALANGNNPSYANTLRVVEHSGSKAPFVVPAPTRKPSVSIKPNTLNMKSVLCHSSGDDGMLARCCFPKLTLCACACSATAGMRMVDTSHHKGP